MEKTKHDTSFFPMPRKVSAEIPPLCKAAMIGNLKMVENLLSSGANIESTAKGGMTPLMFAALFSHETIVAKLIECDANTAMRNVAGFTFREMDYLSNSNTPFYDLRSCKNRTATRNESPLNSYKIQHSKCQRVERGDSILKRRNKSLPKINIQECSSNLNVKPSSHSKRFHSGDTRYSPYPKVALQFHNNKINTPTRANTPNINKNLQNLSPNVAKFFGNVLQLKSPDLKVTKDNEISYLYAAKKTRVSNNGEASGCPVLHKILSDHGFKALSNLFEQQEINIETFSTLNDLDLQQIGVRSLENRQKILAIIKRIY